MPLQDHAMRPLDVEVLRTDLSRSKLASPSKDPRRRAAFASTTFTRLAPFNMGASSPDASPARRRGSVIHTVTSWSTCSTERST